MGEERGKATAFSARISLRSSESSEIGFTDDESGGARPDKSGACRRRAPARVLGLGEDEGHLS